MNIKEFTDKSLDFTIKRVVEIIGIGLILISILLLTALLSYSPADPNFIFQTNSKTNNFLGFRGSYTSDLFFQSIGLISFLIPISIFFTGLNIFKTKKIIIIIDNLFYIVVYCFFGSLFFSAFYSNSFLLVVNGNGGFFGNFVNSGFLSTVLNLNKNISYYFLLIIIFTLFILSTNFSIKSIVDFYSLIKKLFKFNKKNLDSPSDILLQNTTHDENKTTNLIQENLPFSTSTSETTKLSKKFKLPTIDFLKSPSKKENDKSLQKDSVDETFLEKILLDFGVEGKIKKVSRGPVVTLNEFEPAAGIKVSKIINLSEDIARNTSSESARIATIPGSNTIGIELPNSFRENVYLREIINHSSFSKKEIDLPIALGKSISGIPITSDLSSMPHLLIAGTTGSGKSVCINTIILSLLYKHGPDKCKFILIDPKMLELSTYEGIPHLLCPVITEAKKAASVLGWVVKEMESRYKLMTKVSVKNIDGYNSKHKLAMPYIVVIVDEMSDLMLVHGKEIEGYIQKLSQMARAAGIHIIMATQRPSVDVITGTIKANFPTRISFQVTSKIDSRTILGEQGAEQLLGKGDMLFMSSANKIVRIHAPFVSENEIDKINNFLRSQAEPDYVDEILSFADEKENISNLSNNENQDELYNSALEIIKTEGKASTSFLQRKLQIGYNRAARIIDMMEANGEVSKPNHVGKREVLK